MFCGHLSVVSFSTDPLTWSSDGLWTCFIAETGLALFPIYRLTQAYIPFFWMPVSEALLVCKVSISFLLKVRPQDSMNHRNSRAMGFQRAVVRARKAWPLSIATSRKSICKSQQDSWESRWVRLWLKRPSHQLSGGGGGECGRWWSGRKWLGSIFLFFGPGDDVRGGCGRHALLWLWSWVQWVHKPKSCTSKHRLYRGAVRTPLTWG